MLKTVVLATVLAQGMWEPRATGLAPRESLGALARSLSDDKAGVRRAAARTLHGRIRRLVRVAARRGFGAQAAAGELAVVAAEVVPACVATLADPLVTARCADILGWVPEQDSLVALVAVRARASDADREHLDAAASAIRAAVASSTQ